MSLHQTSWTSGDSTCIDLFMVIEILWIHSAFSSYNIFHIAGSNRTPQVEDPIDEHIYFYIFGFFFSPTGSKGQKEVKK